LKLATDELLLLRKETAKYVVQEKKIQKSWSDGQTSNKHAIRMVGQLQTETDRLRSECETLKNKMKNLIATIEIKDVEAETMIRERTLLENRQNDLRQEIRKLSIQLAAKTEECSKARIELVRVEATARAKTPTQEEQEEQEAAAAAASSDGSRTSVPSSLAEIEKQMDHVSNVMLERDNLIFENEKLKRSYNLLKNDSVGMEQALKVCRISRNEILEQLATTEKTLKETVNALNSLKDKNNTLNKRKDEMQNELNAILSKNTNASTMTENMKQNNHELNLKLVTLTNEMNVLADQNQQLKNANVQLNDVERRLRNQLEKARNENDGLAETSTRIERREQDALNQMNNNLVLLNQEKKKYQELKVQLGQSSIVMGRLEDEVDALKTLLKQQQIKQSRWENDEKPNVRWDFFVDFKRTVTLISDPPPPLPHPPTHHL
jgi:chromosome segregation ATPase